MSTPQREPSVLRREWASTTENYLAALAESVNRLRETFQSEEGAPPEADEAVASQVIAACTSVNDWLRSAHAPRGLAKAGGELGAAAGVYRNAAVAFRSLTDAKGDQRQARAKACATLLEQGDHHVEMFKSVLVKKLGDGMP